MISTEKQAELLQSSDISKISLRKGEKSGAARCRPANPIRLFHRSHFFHKRLIFLSAHCPEGQDNLQAKQHQNEQPHLQERERIWHCYMESHFAEFSGKYHCNREADCQGCQRSRKRIANSLIDGHLTELFSGQTDGTKDAVFPLSGQLIGLEIILSFWTMRRQKNQSLVEEMRAME